MTTLNFNILPSDFFLQCHRVEEFEKIFQDVPGEVKQERTVIITEDTELTKHVCKPCRKQTAPRFVSPVTGMIVDQGTDVVLEGIVDGEITFIFLECLDI